MKNQSTYMPLPTATSKDPAPAASAATGSMVKQDPIGQCSEIRLLSACVDQRRAPEPVQCRDADSSMSSTTRRRNDVPDRRRKSMMLGVVQHKKEIATASVVLRKSSLRTPRQAKSGSDSLNDCTGPQGNAAIRGCEASYACRTRLAYCRARFSPRSSGLDAR